MTPETSAATDEGVTVSRQRARELLAIANKADPGIEAGSTFSTREGTRRKLVDVRDHAVAYGIRWTLDMLGLLPDEEAEQ